MSIINEALKKAQQVNVNPDQPSPAPTPAPKAQVLDEAAVQPLSRSIKKEPAVALQPKRTKKYVFFVAVIAVVVGISIMAILIKKPPVAIYEEVVSSIPAQEASRVPHGSTMPPMLSLNGIVYDQDRPYAIVNNKVLLEGDTLEGATLTEINQDNVKFTFKGKEILLNAK